MTAGYEGATWPMVTVLVLMGVISSFTTDLAEANAQNTSSLDTTEVSVSFDSDELTIEEMEDMESPGSNPVFSLRSRFHRKWDYLPSASPSSGRSRGLMKQVRLTMDIAALSARIIMQSDAGEQVRWSPGNAWYGFDHVAGFLKWTTADERFFMILGDYVVNVAQGLLLSRPYGMRISADTPWSIMRMTNSLKGYAGSVEVFAFRGMATRWRIHDRLDVHLFGSLRRFDSRPIQNADPVAYALGKSNEHISPGQLQRRRNLEGRSIGAALEFSLLTARMSLLWMETRFDSPVRVTGYAAGQTRLRAFSLSVRAETGPFRASGEIVGQSEADLSMFMAVQWLPVRSFRAVFGLRRYPSIGGGLFGKPFGFRSSLGDQRGVYAGWTARRSGQWALALYCDTIKGREVDGNVSWPVYYRDLRTTLTVTPRKGSIVRLQLRLKTTNTSGQEQLISGGTIRTSSVSHLQMLSVQASWSHTGIRLTTRFGTSNRTGKQSASTTGYHLHQELDARISSALKLVARYSFFEAPTFDNRFYVYEPDVPGKLAVPVLTDAGTRFMFLASIYSGSNVDVHFKYSVTSAMKMDSEKKGAGHVNAPHQIKTFTVQSTVRW